MAAARCTTVFLMASLFSPFILAAQQATSDQKSTQMLVTEVQQLRSAIERWALLNARTQLAISQLQIQEAAYTRIRKQYEELRTSRASIVGRRSRLTEQVKDLEQKQVTNPNIAMRSVLEDQVRQAKLDLQEAVATEREHSLRESEVGSELRRAQSELADARSRIAELERALDAAYQRLPR